MDPGNNILFPEFREGIACGRTSQKESREANLHSPAKCIPKMQPEPLSMNNFTFGIIDRGRSGRSGGVDLNLRMIGSRPQANRH